MYIIDTHSHLYSESFDEDRIAMIERAIEAGVQKMLLPNIDVDSIQPMYELCEQFPRNCFPMMGLHPGYINEKWEENLAIVKQYLFERENIAVGEIGMDLYWDKTFKNEQAQAFRTQIEWAKELKLPIVIHARDAFDEIFEIVDDLNDSTLSGVFHCFTGNLEQAKRIENYGGFKIGIGGVLTYKKSGLDDVVKDIPMDLLVLETDSPYLPPTPFRGKRNESAYINYVAEKLADIKGMSVEELVNITTQNAENLFKKIR